MKTRFLTSLLRALCTLCFSLLAASDLAAQEQRPLPLPPFVAPMPERLQWTMIISPTEEAKSTAPDAYHAPVISPHALRRVDTTKTGTIKHTVKTYQNGDRREYWFTGGMLLDVDSSRKNVMVVNYKAFGADVLRDVGDPQAMEGWEAFSWLSLNKYKDYVNVNKEPCYHYVLDENTKGSPEAWISAQTKFPVVYRFNNQTYLFQYGPTPTDLQLPPEYETAWKQYQAMVVRAQRIRNSGDR